MQRLLDKATELQSQEGAQGNGEMVEGAPAGVAGLFGDALELLRAANERKARVPRAARATPFSS